MADIDYDGIIKEIDGINPADNEDGLMQTYSAERLVELQTELSSVEPADRNDDHQLAWLGLYDKANALIGELAGQSLEGISKDQLQAYESLISSFASHVGEEYSGIAAELKGKLDARREIIEAESNQDVQESVNDEFVPQNNGNENQQDEDADIKDTVLDVDKQKFLDSINDENKEQITERFNKIDEVADEMGDVFAAPEDENAEDKFKGLRNFYDNLWIDREAPEDENAKPGEDDLKKRKELKDRMQEMAKIMAIQDLLADDSIDGLPKEELKKRMQEAVIDNMSFLSYNLVANQCGFKILESGQDITKLTPKDRQEYMTKLQDGYKAVFEGVNNTLNGGKASPISVGSPAINATILPQYKESKKFAKEIKAKTGITKMLKRVKDFDAKMTKNHPYLWGFAKTTAISALTGPTGIMVYTGITVAKQAKALRKEYKQQKAEKGEDALSFGKFMKQNTGKIASMTISAGFASFSGISGIEGIASLDLSTIGKSILNNTGLLGNMTGSLLSGDALNNVAQNLSWDGIKNAAGNMIDKIANVSNIDASQVLQGIKDSYSPTRLTRLALSGLGVGIAKAHDAYTQAGDGNKWKAARKAFTTHLTGVLVGSALVDTMSAANNVMEQSAIDIQKMENTQSDIQVQLEGLGLGQNAYHIGDPNSGIHLGMEAPKLDDVSIPNVQTPEQILDIKPDVHIQQQEVSQQEVQQNNETPEQVKEVETEQTVELKVNGQEVEAKLGNTLEDTLDNAREQYLHDNPDIDPSNNTVEIEGDGGKATIETQQEDIMKGEAVIGQETTIHREINTDEAQIKDDIQEVKTDTGQAKMMESEGRSDIDTNNNIPDGAKILNVTEFHNENQDLKLTEYEQDGKVYITDGNQTRLAPEGQSAEQRMETWKNMLKETAGAGYDDNGQAIVHEQPAQEIVKEEVKEEVGTIKAEIKETEVRTTEPEIKETHTTEQAANTKEAAQNDAVQNMGITPLTTTQSGLTYSISENGQMHINADFGGIHENGTLNMRYVNHLLPEEYTDPNKLIATDDINKVKAELRGIVMRNEVYNDLQAQSATRELTGNEKTFMQAHEAQLEQKGLISREDGVLEYKDTPKDQYFQVEQPRENATQGLESIDIVSTGDHYDTPDGLPPVYEGDDKIVTAEQAADPISTGDHYDTPDGLPPVYEGDDKVVTAEQAADPISTGDHYDTPDGLPPVYDPNEDNNKLSAAEKISMLRNGHSLQSSHGSLSDRINAMKGNSNSYDEFMASVQQGYSNNINAVEEEYSSNAEAIKQEYSNFVENTNNEYNANAANVNREYSENVDKINKEFENTQQQWQQEHDSFLAQKAAYEASHSGYQDYSSSVQQLGLHNSSVLSHSEGIQVKSHEFNGNSASYKIYEQTEFRQGSNGFALSHNDEIRSVTTDGKGNLEFKVTENGQSRLMTKEEVNNFCSEIKSQGEKVDNFNGKLLKHIEDTKNVKTAMGKMEYGSAPKTHTDGGTQHSNTSFKGKSSSRV